MTKQESILPIQRVKPRAKPRGGAHHTHDVFAFVRDTQALGLSCALLVITDIRGGTLRANGSVMAVCSDGQIRGYISNGCVDSDIILHAHNSLKNGKTVHLHYGEGSPFVDIKLACGGYIKIQIIPNPAADTVAKIADGFERRTKVIVQYEAEGKLSSRKTLPNTISQTSNVFTYQPKIKLSIAGRGAVVERLAILAADAGFVLEILSPDFAMQKWAQGNQFTFIALSHPSTPPVLETDPWTAHAMMFHDHNWEQALLQQTLNGNGFYIGALGSVKTHAVRCEALLNNGVPQNQIDKIHGPIGSIPAQRDANLIALSTLAQILEMARSKGRIN